MQIYIFSLYPGTADGEGDGEGTDGHNEEEGGKKVNNTHSHREGGDDKVTVAHTDKAELLLKKTDNESQQ